MKNLCYMYPNWIIVVLTSIFINICNSSKLKSKSQIKSLMKLNEFQLECEYPMEMLVSSKK